MIDVGKIAVGKVVDVYTIPKIALEEPEPVAFDADAKFRIVLPVITDVPVCTAIPTKELPEPVPL